MNQFVTNLISNDPWVGHVCRIAVGTCPVDFVTTIFLLSAIHSPVETGCTDRNLTFCNPGGLLIFVVGKLEVLAFGVVFWVQREKKVPSFRGARIIYIYICVYIYTVYIYIYIYI